jgi:N-hydroxyarylamine O-acetyltransferase
MDTEAYLHRIGYRGEIAPTNQTLCELQVRHLLTIPFENLDIHLGRPIVLQESALFDKIVNSGRGGFCYELNATFAWLLTGLGFGVEYLSARDALPDGSFGPDFDHLTLRVRVPSQSALSMEPPVQPGRLEPGWLVDVGWGDTFREPLPLVPEVIQEQGRRAFRIDPHEDGYLLWQRKETGEWKRDFLFHPQARQLVEFEPLCAWQQSSSESRWTQERLCTLPTAEGRMTLRDSRLTVTKGGNRVERWITSPGEYSAVLASCFGIRLSPDLCARLM